MSDLEGIVEAVRKIGFSWVKIDTGCFSLHYRVTTILFIGEEWVDWRLPFLHAAGARELRAGVSSICLSRVTVQWEYGKWLFIWLDWNMHIAILFRRRLRAEGAKPKSNKRWKTGLGHVCMYVCMYVCIFVCFSHISHNLQRILSSNQYRSLAHWMLHCLGMNLVGCGTQRARGTWK